MRLSLIVLTVFLSFSAHAAKSQVIHHTLFDWSVPKAWNISYPGSPKKEDATDIELKAKDCTVSLFISKGEPANIVSIQEARLRKENPTASFSHVKWNGQDWLLAEFEKRTPKHPDPQKVVFAVTEKKKKLFSALALAPKSKPTADLTKVLSGLKLK